MFSQILSHDPYIQVTNPPPSYVNGYNSGALNVGQVRYNTSTQSLEAYDGSSWIMIASGGTAATITLSHRARDILAHAEKQMMQDEKFAAMAKEHPAIADALETFKEAAEKLQVVVALCEE